MSEHIEMVPIDTKVGRRDEHQAHNKLKPWNRLVGSALLRANVLLFVTNMMASGFSYLFHPVVGHFLGPKGYGSVGPLLALSSILLIPTQIVVYIANKPAADFIAHGRIDQINYLYRRAFRYAILIGVLTMIAFYCLVPFLTSFLNLSSIQPVIILGIGFALSYASPLNTGVIQGRQQFGWLAFINFISSFLRVALTIVFLMLGLAVNGALLASLIAALLVYAISFLPVRDVLRAPQAPVVSLKPLLVYSTGTAVTIACGTLLVSLDTILARHFLSPTDAGYYAALAKIGQTVLFIGGSLVWVMFPKVATLEQQGRPHGSILAWTMAGVFALSAAALLVFWLFPSQIITIMFHAPTVVAQELVHYAFAMLLLSIANVLIFYNLSLGRMAFVPILVACCILEVILISVWHGSLSQIVTAMIVVMLFLFCGQACLYILQFVRAKRRLTLMRS